MSVLGKLFGRTPFATLRAEAERLREAGEHGAAKLAYERAGAARDASEDQRAAMRAEAEASCDTIAEMRLEEARRLLEQGQHDLVLSELENALETAVSEGLQARIRRALDGLQRVELQRERQVAGDEPDADARFESLGGSWEVEQHAEYAGYGDAFRQAMLQLHDGEVGAARQVLEESVASAQGAHYLWFEVGRARLADGDDHGAEQAYAEFLGRIGPSEGGDTRLAAHMTLAALRNEAGDLEGAIAHYQDALEAMPDDPRTYLAMGSLLRQQGMAQEALDVIDSGLAVVEDGQPHFRLWLECGLCHAAAGHQEQAMTWLEQVVELLAARQHFDLPPEGTRCLAELHEEAGNLARAADLYRMLAGGSDTEHLLDYHRQAARLLTTLGQRADARRMLVRAQELVAVEDAATREELDAELAAL